MYNACMNLPRWYGKACKSCSFFYGCAIESRGLYAKKYTSLSEATLKPYRDKYSNEKPVAKEVADVKKEKPLKKFRKQKKSELKVSVKKKKKTFKDDCPF